MDKFLQLHQNHYYSIESILASDQPVPCIFKKEGRHLGFLEMGSRLYDIERGTELHLPFWLSKTFTPYKDLIKVEVTKVYKKTYGNIIKADATIIDLNQWSRFYYILGKYFINLNPEENELTFNLILMFRKRFCFIMDWSNSIMTEHVLISKLDFTEIWMLERGKKVAKKMREYLKENKPCLIKASAVMIEYKKRKVMNERFSMHLL